MKRIRIKGGNKLTGTIRISGAKNSAVALIPASLLSDGVVKIDNIPDISDIESLNEILEYLGAKVTRDGDVMEIDSSCIENKPIPEEISAKLRASYYFMSSLLGKYKKVEMYFPGGCSIGKRPINLHLKGFEALGAKVKEKNNKFIITADRLVGTQIYLDFASVGATINLMLAATKAEGTTIIENAAKEPHIVNVATFLNNMGAKITGAGTDQIKIVGVDKLGSCFHEVVPDYIETGTYMIIASAMGKNIKITNAIPDHVEALTLKLREMGISVKTGPDYIEISRGSNLKPVNIKTQVYPGFPTDLQQPFATLLTQCKGKSSINETIWENRFMNLSELKKMGATTTFKSSKGYITGPTKLNGTEVTATDLRAGAGLIVAGLIAEGITIISDVEHILRGYEQIIQKLTEVGAKIELIQI